MGILKISLGNYKNWMKVTFINTIKHNRAIYFWHQQHKQKQLWSSSTKTSFGRASKEQAFGRRSSAFVGQLLEDKLCSLQHVIRNKQENASQWWWWWCWWWGRWWWWKQCQWLTWWWKWDWWIRLSFYESKNRTNLENFFQWKQNFSQFFTFA